MKQRSSVRKMLKMQTKPAVLWALMLMAVLTVGAGLAVAGGTSANTLYKRGELAEARENYDEALENYKSAMAKAPKDIKYRAAYYRVVVNASAGHITKGRKYFAVGDKNNALLEYMRAAEIDPSNEAALQAIEQVKRELGKAPTKNSEVVMPAISARDAEIDSMSSPAILRPVTNEPITLKMTEDTKVIYQAIGRASGINVLFDPDYNSKRIPVDLSNVSYSDALRIVGTISGTFWRAVTPNTIFVAANTKTKHTDLDEQAVQTFYLSNAWQQNDLTDVQTALRNVLPNIKVAAVASQNSIVVRGTPDELLLAGKLVNDLDKPRGEVIVDVAVMEVSKNWERNIGLSWPSTIAFGLQSESTTTTSGSSTTTTSGTTLSTLGGLNSGNVSVTVSSATANLLLTDSSTKLLQNPRIRSTDAQKATMKIGSRIPVATGSYSTGTATTSVSSLVNTQFQYQDVGVNIEITPTVHYDHDVTLKLKIEVTAESGSVTISSVTEPIISQRTTEGTIRLREGEASILSGILNKQDTVSKTGIPGLSSIPLVKYLFGSKDHTITDDEIVFMLVPHVVRSQDLTPANLRMVDTGAGTAIQLRRVEEKPATTPAETPANLPSVKPSRNTLSTYPGQSAEAAAPNALRQMRSEAEGLPTANATPTAGPKKAPLNFVLATPSGTVAPGATFAVPVQLSDVEDATSIPLQIQYDAAKLSLVNIVSGDLLGKDGQAVATVHRDDPVGNLTVNLSRPPNAAGVSGSGMVCVLKFQAKAVGDAHINISKASVLDSNQQPTEGHGGDVKVTIQ